MKKLLSLLFSLCIILSLCVVPGTSVSAQQTKEYEGKTYICVNTKADYTAIVNKMLKNHENFTNVYYIEGQEEWDSAFTNDGRNFTGHGTRLHFSSYMEYTPDSVSITANKRPIYDELNIFQGFTEESYGYIEIRYADNKDELAKADAKIKSILAGISSKSDAEKIKYIAEYICNATESGSQKDENGGYDMVNGVYDVLHGVRTNTVCASFAMTFQRFMELAGIDACLLANKIHVVNMVYVEGAWYGVDVTWMDDGPTPNYNYLLMGYDRLKGYDVEGRTPIAEFKKTNKIADTQYGKTAAKPAASSKPSNNTAATSSKKPAATVSKNDNTVQTQTPASSEVASSSELQSSAPTESAEVKKVDLTEDTVIKDDIFADAAVSGTDISLEGEDFTWRFEASSIDTAKVWKDFDASVKMGENVPKEQVEQITKAAGNKEVYPFTFAHHGELPGEAEICIRVDEQYVGKQVYIYYLNDDGIPVEAGREQVSDGAELTFSTDHCSLWFISEDRIENAITGENKPAVLWIVLAVALAAAAAAAAVVFIIIKRKKA